MSITYRPYITEDRAGLRIEQPGKAPVFLYFNPSDGNNPNDADVFIYMGSSDDPLDDSTMCFIPTDPNTLAKHRWDTEEP